MKNTPLSHLYLLALQVTRGYSITYLKIQPFQSNSIEIDIASVETARNQ